MFSAKTIKMNRRTALPLKPDMLVHRLSRPMLDQAASLYGHYHRFILLNSRVLQMAFSISRETPLNERWLLVENLDLGYKELVFAIPRIGLDIILAVPLEIRRVLGIPANEDGETARLGYQFAVRHVTPKSDVGTFDVPQGSWLGRPFSRHIEVYLESINQSKASFPECFSMVAHVALLRPLEMTILGVAPLDSIHITNLANRSRVAALALPQHEDNLAMLSLNDHLKHRLGLPAGTFRNESGILRVAKFDQDVALTCPACAKATPLRSGLPG